MRRFAVPLPRKAARRSDPTDGSPRPLHILSLFQEFVHRVQHLRPIHAAAEAAALAFLLVGAGAGADDGVQRRAGRCFRLLLRKTAQKMPSIVKKFREPQVTDDIPGTRA